MALPHLPPSQVLQGTLGRRLAAFMLVGFLALIAAGFSAAWVMEENSRHTGWVAHSYQVENAIVDSRRLLEQAETTRRGYLLVPGDPAFLASYGKASQALRPALDRLARLVADNSDQTALLARLRTQLTDLTARRTQTIDMIRAGRVEEARAAFRADSAAQRMIAIRATSDRMLTVERGLLATRDADLKQSEQLFFVILVIAGLLLVGVALVSLATVIGYTRDLTHSRDQLSQLNETLEEIVTERTAGLTRANEEIQRFAYIVSHDLRSPLVNVMGFTSELEASAITLRTLVDRAEAEAPAVVSDEARFAAREDLPEAIGFIRSSTQKMDRLINAILQLSRQGRRPLAPEPVDLAAMVAAIRDTLSHRLDERDAVLEAADDLPGIVTDRFAMDQILSNLIDNAVKYLRPGVPGRIVVRGHRAGPRAVIEVMDNGRGIDARDHQRVFDLFRRSGTQDVAGEGIGLATVRALAFRLGGTIDVTSTLGQGTTFRLNLPITLDLQDTKE